MESPIAHDVEEVEEFFEPIENAEETAQQAPAAAAAELEEEDNVYDEVENNWEPDAAADADPNIPTESKKSVVDQLITNPIDTEILEEIAEPEAFNLQEAREPDALKVTRGSIVEETLSPQGSPQRNVMREEPEPDMDVVEEIVVLDASADAEEKIRAPEAERSFVQTFEVEEGVADDIVTRSAVNAKDARGSGKRHSHDADFAPNTSNPERSDVLKAKSSIVEDVSPVVPSEDDKPAAAEVKKKSRSMALAEHKRKAQLAEQQMQLQAEQEQEAKANALKARAAKRLEEQEKREQRELLKQRRNAAAEQRAAAQGGGIAAEADEARNEGDGEEQRSSNVVDEPAKHAHVRSTGSHPSKIRSIVKNSKDSEAEADSSTWNDSIAAPVSASRKERHEAVEKRRLERLEARARKLAHPSGIDQSVAEGDADESSEVLRPFPVKPDQQQGRSHNVKRRLRAQPTASSADSDANRLILPPLAGAKQPRSSPNPARAALSSLLRDSEFPEPSEVDGTFTGSPSGKPRRHRKPLYMRMIEKAQQQYVEDERRKHESYVEQKKMKQRNNPTQEELRMHRRKHDELVHAKLEEGRRNLAEAAAANARALKRQQAVASLVQATLDEKGEGELFVDGTSPLRKRQTKKKPSGGGISDSSAALKDMVPLPPLSSKRRSKAEGVADYGFSPSKSALDDAFSDSRQGSAEERRNARVSPAAIVSVAAAMHSITLDASPPNSRREVAESSAAIHHVPLQFDVGAAAAAVQKIPALTAHAIPTYCASDWLDKLATTDTDLPTSATTAGASTGSSAQVLLKPAPPHTDAQKLMNFAVP